MIPKRWFLGIECSLCPTPLMFLEFIWQLSMINWVTFCLSIWHHFKLHNVTLKPLCLSIEFKPRPGRMYSSFKMNFIVLCIFFSLWACVLHECASSAFAIMLCCVLKKICNIVSETGMVSDNIFQHFMTISAC